jgi:hypothetical protein
MNATLRALLAAVACVWLLSTVAMAQAAGRPPASGLGGRELILIAAIALLFAGVSRLSGLEETRSIRESHGVDGVRSRAYLDRLLGPARIRVSADELPRAATEARTGRVLAEKRLTT